MKTNLILVALIAICNTASAGVVTEDQKSTVGNVGQNYSQKNVSQAGSGPVSVSVTTIVMPRLNSGPGGTTATNVIATTLSGGLTNTARTSLTNVCVAGGWFAPQDITAVVTGSTNTFSRGEFNPGGVWAGSPGDTLVALITVTAGDGGTVSLSEIEFSGASSDATNILRKEVSFATNSYTPTAVGVRSDSTLVTSGSGSQLVSKVIFLVACRNFVVATTNDYNQVVQYLLNNTNANGQFVVTATARVVRGGVTVASGTDQTVFTVGPRIHEKVVGDFQLLTALSGAGRLYGVESTTEFVGDGPGTVWTNTGLTVGSRESISLPTDIEHKFYRLVTLP